MAESASAQLEVSPDETSEGQQAPAEVSPDNFFKGLVPEVETELEPAISEGEVSTPAPQGNEEVEKLRAELDRLKQERRPWLVRQAVDNAVGKYQNAEVIKDLLESDPNMSERQVHTIANYVQIALERDRKAVQQKYQEQFETASTTHKEEVQRAWGAPLDTNSAAIAGASIPHRLEEISVLLATETNTKKREALNVERIALKRKYKEQKK